MTAKLCTNCLSIAVPKTYTPSRLRTEATVWMAFLAIGAVVGLLSGAPARQEIPSGRQLATVNTPRLSSVSSNPAEERIALPDPVGHSGRGATLRFASWIGVKVLRFATTFWWVLIVPLGFSIWRQVAKYPGCRDCGSRRLLEVPHELW